MAASAGTPNAGAGGTAGTAGVAGTGGNAGAAGSVDAGADASPPSLYCGDSIRDPVLEECDDGPDTFEDACTENCRAHNYFVVPPVLFDGGSILGSRSLGLGLHPVAAGGAGSAVAFVETEGSSHSLEVAFFDPFGRRLGSAIDAGAGALPSEAANPVLAALPGGAYALAWNDLSTGALQVAMRVVSPSSLGSVVFASSAPDTGSTQDPDLAWTGTGLVAVWRDNTFGAGPQVRTFDQDLAPVASESALGAGGASPGVTAFAGSWAAARRVTDASSLETIEISTPSSSWTVGPFAPGASLERPALLALDGTHLVVVFTESTDPLQSGTANVTRLAAAVLDTGSQGPTPMFELPPSLAPWANDATLSERRPSLARSGTRFYLAWQTESPLGDPLDDEAFLRELSWDGTTLSLLPEMPIEADAPRLGPQRAPVIASTPLGPEGALVTAWEDSSADPPHTMLPDLVFGLRPTPIVVLGPPDGGA